MNLFATATYRALIRDATAWGRSWLGLSDAAAGRTELGLGTMATQGADAVAITGGTISGAAITGGTIGGITPLAVSDGGTGARKQSPTKQ